MTTPLVGMLCLNLLSGKENTYTLWLPLLLRNVPRPLAQVRYPLYEALMNETTLLLGPLAWLPRNVMVPFP